ncbi:MAG: nicotinamide riboside transporter PnuC [Bacteroidales bacterium]|nr:nicotinamide riboside transporter PnuC [Bacteroidales bacterium]MDI3479695.1 nicotinamide mononucleotide transporter [Rikenellaceae bacterium]
MHWIEIIAASLGIIAIYFQIKVKPFYWVISLLVSSMYIIIYFLAKLYADMSMQFYYVGMSIYGLYVWLSGNNNSDKKTIPISKIKDLKSWLLIALISALSFFIIGYILKKFTDSNVPWWDSFTTSLSFVATWMLARKKIENWLIWIVVDATSVVLYIYKQLYPTTILFIILTLLAIVGYFQWKRELRILENS